MRNSIRDLALVSGACILLFLPSACTKSKAPGVSPLASIEASANPTPTEPIAQAIDGLVTYVEGSATVTRQGQKAAASIGMTILEGDVLSTSDNSFLEISWGEETRINLKADTVASLDRATVSDLRLNARLSVNRGAVLGKVRKLSGADSFEVRTASTYCGVRGTYFLVSAAEDATTIAVREGSVKALYGGKLLDSLSDLAAKKSAARLALKTIVSLAPTVNAGQELTFSRKRATRAEAEYAKLRDQVTSGADDLNAEGQTALIQAEDLPDQASGGQGEYSSKAKALAELCGEPRPISQKYSVMFAERPAKPEKPRPTATPNPALLNVLPGTGANARGAIIQAGGIALESDEANRVRAVDPNGKVLWIAGGQTGSSYPVVFKNRIYQAGLSGLNVLSNKDGMVERRIPLQNDLIPVGARRPLQTDAGLAIALNSGLGIIDPDSGNAIASIDLPYKSAVTPVAFKSKLIALVNEKGVFQIIDLATKEIKASVQTEARGKNVSALRRQGNLFFFTDDAERAILVNAESGQVAWQKQLPGRVTADAEMGQEAVYVPTSLGTVIFSLESGEEIQTISEASGPILLSKSRLYLCTGFGSLIVAEAYPYKEIARLSLPFVGTCRPLMIGDTLWVAGQGGKMARIDPALIAAN